MSGHPDLDERIAAYLDGAMSESDAAAFESEIADNPLLAAEMERLAGNDALLREAFAEPEVDDAFLEKMGLGQSAPDVPHIEHSGIAAANDNPPFWRRWSVPIGGAIAASLALVATLSLQQGAGGPGMGDALETTPSGQLAALDDGASLTPLLSFQAGDGRFCREFAYASGTAERGGIACRGGDGWQVEAWGEGAAPLPDPGEIALASGADTGALEDAYARLQASDPILADRENALIERGWSAD